MTAWTTHECQGCGNVVDIDLDATTGDVLLCECGEALENIDDPKINPKTK